MRFSLFALTRQFVVQGLFGLWIIVHRILNGKHFETIVALKLGKSFSSIVYLLVVACEEKNTFNTIYIYYIWMPCMFCLLKFWEMLHVLCTMIAIAATYFLGQLSFSHALLIRKAIYLVLNLQSCIAYYIGKISEIPNVSLFSQMPLVKLKNRENGYDIIL